MGSRDVDVESPDGLPSALAPRTPSEDESLFAQLGERSGPRYIAFVVVLALVLAVLLALAAYAQGGSGRTALRASGCSVWSR